MKYSLDKLVIKTQTGFVVVKLSDVVFLEGDGNYTTIHLNNSKRILISKILKNFEEQIKLSELNFFRIHKSYLINLDYLQEFRGCKEKKVILMDSIEIPASSRKIKELCQFMNASYSHFQ